MPDRPEATGFAKCALDRGVAGTFCDFSRQRGRQLARQWSRLPDVRLEIGGGHERIEALFVRRVQGERTAGRGGDDVR